MYICQEYAYDFNMKWEHISDRECLICKIIKEPEDKWGERIELSDNLEDEIKELENEIGDLEIINSDLKDEIKELENKKRNLNNKLLKLLNIG